MYVAIFISAIALWWAVLQLLEDRRPPVVLHSSKAVPGKAQAGGAIWIEAQITRNRYCPGTVYEFWRQNGSVVQGDIAPASPTDTIGQARLQFKKDLPKELEPGNWCYAPMIVYDCADRQHVLHPKPTCFDVE